MGRVISTENLVTERNRMLKAMAIATRELAKQPSFNAASRDLLAFLVLALEKVAESIERSVMPWEKRGYWLKADRFRMDWDWVGPLASKLRTALMSEDEGQLAQDMAALSQKLSGVKVAEKHRIGTPWLGAMEKLKASEVK